MQLFLLLGANLGDRVQTLAQAQTRLVQAVGPLVGASGLYETAPWGVTDQPAYLNQVLELDTQLPPPDVLVQTQAIEQALGRVRLHRWGARVIDIDLLYYADTVLRTDRLTLPHPLLHERRFTLVPLCELAPYFIHPVLHQTNAELLQQCPDTGEVSRFIG